MKTGINRRIARDIAKANSLGLVGVGESYLGRTPLIVIIQFSNNRMD